MFIEVKTSIFLSFNIVIQYNSNIVDFCFLPVALITYFGVYCHCLYLNCLYLNMPEHLLRRIPISIKITIIIAGEHYGISLYERQE